MWCAPSFMAPALKTHTPQIWGVEISPPKFRGESSKNTVKQVIFEPIPPKFGVWIVTPQIWGYGVSGCGFGPLVLHLVRQIAVLKKTSGNAHTLEVRPRQTSATSLVLTAPISLSQKSNKGTLALTLKTLLPPQIRRLGLRTLPRAAGVSRALRARNPKKGLKQKVSRGPKKSGKSLEKVPSRHFRDFLQTFLGLFRDFFQTFRGPVAGLLPDFFGISGLESPRDSCSSREGSQG